MPRGPAKIKRIEVERFLRGICDAEIPILRVEMDGAGTVSAVVHELLDSKPATEIKLKRIVL